MDNKKVKPIKNYSSPILACFIQKVTKNLLTITISKIIKVFISLVKIIQQLK